MKQMLQLTEDQIVAFLAKHDPAAQAQQMVYEIWENGEVTLTKGGALYAQRSVATVWSPQTHMAPSIAIDVERMPKKGHKGHGCIQVQGDINEILEILFGKCTWTDRWYV